MTKKCPKCGRPLDYIEVYDSERDDELMFEYYVGCCSNCDAEYQWKEVFEIKLIKVENFCEC